MLGGREGVNIIVRRGHNQHGLTRIVYGGIVDEKRLRKYDATNGKCAEPPELVDGVLVDAGHVGGAGAVVVIALGEDIIASRSGKHLIGQNRNNDERQSLSGWRNDRIGHGRYDRLYARDRRKHDQSLDILRDGGSREAL